MMIEMNGEKHFEMFVSEKEMAVVKAMRLGGEINVRFHELRELKEADECMELFEKCKKEGISWIKEMSGFYGGNYISFLKQMGNVEVSCFLEIKKD